MQGFASAATGCFGDCYMQFFPGTNFGIPKSDVVFLSFIVAVELIASSIWIINRREVGSSRIHGEISILVSAALLGMAAYIPVSREFVMPAYSDAGFSGILFFVLIFESVLLVWLAVFRIVHKRAKGRTLGERVVAAS
ncbi:MAG: hypothetical protein ACREAN_00970, partial [Nitrosopumilaceae archaeon]